jgi:hypothetical protein
MNEHFIFLSSQDSKDYFEDNTPYKFTVHLTETLDLTQGTWYCALKEVSLKLTTPVNMYIYCNIVEDTHVLGRKKPILQFIPRQQKTIVQSYDSSIAFRVKQPCMQTITIYIEKRNGAKPPFTRDMSHCTLHLFQKECIHQ